MTRVGVVGAGVMGTGLAQSLTEYGHEVVLVDRSKEALDLAQAEILKFERFGALLGATGPSREGMSGRVTCTTDLADLSTVEFLVENITESWELKRALYPQLDEAAPESCVFAVNTSAIPITKVAARTTRQDRVIGTHFMNPVPMKPTVEVIKGWHTSQETIDATLALLGAFGKSGVQVNDSPGFVSNRVLMLTINEAVYLVADGVAEPEDVDRIFTECFGHTMGPLATADLIGLDTILYSIDVLYENFNDGKYRPCPLLQRMVDAGLYGRKSGRGFFAYEA
ncbi:3-hydroxyacyl-CoA dehydrogenase family protein [Streptomyces radicis]|uniref:3-hydroxybutyryl-CoA dehydrogenase n=1 Tax=Streptomyces radicis TaxID=1750517 RepID=A0A3A9WJU3_9ACTN|nr:3-hydroxyacyl-CoA dehydrogenase NAD-binding domain-containing protein [Streptomyces radicis]RKN12862.1 3-hydroxybutyryl-CoA dehydrogenase [Streptomyces radicis]RKN27373.1 3-hydroxybutyryl-CoA dehydrogenase [Streptomyces radicis]